MHKRIEREKRILNLMINEYCNIEHQNINGTCSDCQDLIKYTEKKLLTCPFLEDKPVCSKCDIHCYNKNQKEKIKQVMRKIGPRMIYTHTWDTLWYYFYKFIHKNQKVTQIHENPNAK